MRLHRLKLDPQMRSLGDTYARKEFRLHGKPQAERLSEAAKQLAVNLPTTGHGLTAADVRARVEKVCCDLA